MVDVKTEGKERETDDLKAKLDEEGKLLPSARKHIHCGRSPLLTVDVFFYF